MHSDPEKPVMSPRKRVSIKRISNWYARNERPISTLSLVGGFIFNALTLTRVDQFWENFWVAAHIFVVAVCIILINREENEGSKSILGIKSPEKLHFWLTTVLQFTFGGLLSTFIVFYFRSAVLAVTWPFFAILILAFVANESFKRHYARMSFQITFFFLSIFLFSIFLLPVLLHEISTAVFLMSGGLSVLVLILFLLVLKRFTKEGFKKGKAALFSSVIALYLLVNGLYFLNLIPPLPLSLQDAGVYHSIKKNVDGNYVVSYEAGGFFSSLERYIDIYPSIHISTSERVYAYSAVFSPLSFDTVIDHQWQRYDETNRKWVTVTQVSLYISGGRAGGYRTYSTQAGLTAGKWRVNVKTPSGQLIGRMNFTVVVSDTTPSLQTEVKE